LIQAWQAKPRRVQKRTLLSQKFDPPFLRNKFGCAMRATLRELRRSVKLDAYRRQHAHTSKAQSDEPRPLFALRCAATIGSLISFIALRIRCSKDLENNSPLIANHRNSGELCAQRIGLASKLIGQSDCVRLGLRHEQRN